MPYFTLFTFFVPIIASILLITGTIIYLVKSVKEHSNNSPKTSKKAPLIVLSIGAVFDLYILLLVLFEDGAILFK